jgi:transposase
MTRGRRRDLNEIVQFIATSAYGTTTADVAKFLGVRRDTALDYIQTLNKQGILARVCIGPYTKWTTRENLEFAESAWLNHLAMSKVRKSLTRRRALTKVQLEDMAQEVDYKPTQRTVPASSVPRPEILGPTSVFDVR